MANFDTKLKDWDVVSFGNTRLNFSSNLPKNGNCSKPSLSVFDKVPTNSQPTNQEKLTKNTTHQKNTDSDVTDLNILKSVKTYSRKNKNILSSPCDKLYLHTENLLENSKNEIQDNFAKKTADQTLQTVRSINSFSKDILRNTNGNGEFEPNLDNNFTNDINNDLKPGLFNDELEDCILSEYNSPDEASFSNSNELKHSNSTKKTNDGYIRTRKNLKNRIVGKRKLDFGFEQTCEENSKDMRFNPYSNSDKVMGKNEFKTSVHTLQTNNSSKMTQVGGNTKIRPIAKSIKYPKALNSQLQDTIVPVQNGSLSNKNKATGTVILDSRKQSLSMLDMVKRFSVKRPVEEINETLVSRKKQVIFEQDKSTVPHSDMARGTEYLISESVSCEKYIEQNDINGISHSLKNGFSVSSRLGDDLIENNTSSLDNIKKTDVDYQVAVALGLITEPKKKKGKLLNEIRQNHGKDSDKSIGNSRLKASNSTLFSKKRKPRQSLPKTNTKKKPVLPVEVSDTVKPPQLSLTTVSPMTQHLCSKPKLDHVSIFVCDCNAPNSTTKNPTALSSLIAKHNKVASALLKVSVIVKENPDGLQSYSSNHYSTLCDTVQTLDFNLNTFPQCDAEKNCNTFRDPNSSSSVSKSELSDQSLNSFCDLELDHLFENHQCQAFIRKIFDRIKEIHEECVFKMRDSDNKDLDEFEFMYTVKDFCNDPDIVKVMSEFFEDCDDFAPSLPTETCIKFKFSKDFQDDPVYSVIKDFSQYFARKMWPPNSKTISSRSVLKFAYENMSFREIAILSRFFYETELLKPKDFVSRLTYVALFAMYGECKMRMGS